MTLLSGGTRTCSHTDRTPSFLLLFFLKNNIYIHNLLSRHIGITGSIITLPFILDGMAAVVMSACTSTQHFLKSVDGHSRRFKVARVRPIKPPRSRIFRKPRNNSRSHVVPHKFLLLPRISEGRKAANARSR